MRKRSSLLRSSLVIAAVMLGASACTTGQGPSAESTSAAIDPADVVADIPASALVRPGVLTICSDIPVPPFEMYDEEGSLEGFDVEIGNEISRRLGLEPVWQNSVFDTIIAALTSGKCDTIINDMFITPERQAQIHQIPYFYSGQSFMVLKGNPDGIDPENAATMCGKTLTTQLGGAMVEDAKKYSDDCQSAGKAPITLLQPSKFNDSLQQLQTGQAAALFYDAPVNTYYEGLQPETFEIVGPILEDEIQLGIGVEKDNQVLIDGLTAALKSIQEDGFFGQALKNWGLEDTRIPELN